MREREVFLLRLQALRQELDRARGAVEDISPRLGKRVRSGFVGRFEDLQECLSNLEQGIMEADDYVLNQRWDCLRRMRRDDCEPLFRESLALVQGSLVRAGGLDGGLCAIADALLYDLGFRTFITWGRFTILDLGESFVPMVEVIRLRYPEASVWSLPIAAHEFGHFVAPRLEATRHTGSSYHPVQELLDREAKDPRQWHHLNELFADLFATYVLGPAYACACIMLRWDPWTAYFDGEQHPSDAKRVYWILKILDAMNESAEGGEPTYWRVVKELREAWTHSLKIVGQPESLDEHLNALGHGAGPQSIEQLDQWFKVLYQAVGENNKLVSARYTGQDWLRAQGMMKQLSEKTALVVADDDRVAHVLNAAWWCRVRHAPADAEYLQRIGERAVELCRVISARDSL